MSSRTAVGSSQCKACTRIDVPQEDSMAETVPGVIVMVPVTAVIVAVLMALVVMVVRHLGSPVATAAPPNRNPTTAARARATS